MPPSPPQPRRPPRRPHLPNELWHSIVAHFALPPHRVGQYGPSADFRARRATLHSLCATSRQLQAVALPFLYESIVLVLEPPELPPAHQMGQVGQYRYHRGATALPRLLRTLLERPDLRPLVKNLAVPMNLNHFIPWDGAERLAIPYWNIALAWLAEHADDLAADRPLYAALSPADRRLVDLVGLGPDDLECVRLRVQLQPHPDLAEKLLALVLGLVPALERLLLQESQTLDKEHLRDAIMRVVAAVNAPPTPARAPQDADLLAEALDCTHIDDAETAHEASFRLLPRLRNAVMRVVNAPPPPQDAAMLAAALDRTHIDDAETAHAAPARPPPMLPRLTTLQVQAHPLAGPVPQERSHLVPVHGGALFMHVLTMRAHDNLVPVHGCVPCMHVMTIRDTNNPDPADMEDAPNAPRPALRRLDVCKARFDEWIGTWMSEAEERAMARLTDLRLDADARAEHLWQLVGPTTALRSLHLDLYQHADGQPYPAPRQGRDLDGQLAERAATLERFALRTVPHCGSLADLGPQLGPLGRLTVLPAMGALRDLSVEPHLLLDWLDVNQWPKFWATLPPALERLSLRFDPEDGADSLRIWARSGLGAVLRAGVEEEGQGRGGAWKHPCKARVPKLRTVRLVPLPYGLRAAEEIRADLGKVGIGLEWLGEGEEEEEEEDETW